MNARSTPKDHPENTAAGKEAKARAVEADKSTAEVQRRVDQETERGFRGVEVDPTPNENYSVQGVIQGAPTPETDSEAAEKARQGQAKAAGVADADPGRRK